MTATALPTPAATSTTTTHPTTAMTSTTSITTKTPPATSTTTNLLPATSTTTNLLPALNEENLIVVPIIEEENLLVDGGELDDVDEEANLIVVPEEEKEMVIQEKDKVVDYKVVRNPEDGSIECTCRHFLRYGFLCRHAFCVLKNRNIKLIPERYGEKDEAIEKLTNDANFVVDECLFWLRKDEAELKKFVETLENIWKEIQAKVPRPPQKTRDVIEYAIKMPQENKVNNPQRARNKGGRRGERRKSGREISMKAKAKRARKCGHCGEKTNKHTKSTCLLNPKYIAKVARIEAEKAKTQATTSEAANEQEPTNTATNES